MMYVCVYMYDCLPCSPSRLYVRYESMCVYMIVLLEYVRCEIMYDICVCVYMYDCMSRVLMYDMRVYVYYI
jgi:hypothetical protein